MNILRKARGILGTAILSSVAWAPLGLIWAFALWILTQREFRTQSIPFPPVLAIMLMCAAWGFVSGLLFATVLALTERRRTKVELISRSRVAVFGALAGATLPIALPQLLTLSFIAPGVVMLVSGIYGMATSVGMLEIAKANSNQKDGLRDGSLRRVAESPLN